MIRTEVAGQREAVEAFQQLGKTFEELALDMRSFAKCLRQQDTCSAEELDELLKVLSILEKLAACGTPYDTLLVQAGVPSAGTAVLKSYLGNHHDDDDEGEGSEIATKFDALTRLISEVLANCTQATRTPQTIQVSYRLKRTSRGGDPEDWTLRHSLLPLSFTDVETAGMIWGSSLLSGLFLCHCIVNCFSQSTFHKGSMSPPTLCPKCLELGCGTGATSSAFARCWASTAGAVASLPLTRLILTDLSEKIVNRARFNLLGQGDGDLRNVEVIGVSHDITSEQLVDEGKFSLVLASDMFFCVSLTSHVIRSVASHLRKGEYIFTSSTDDAVDVTLAQATSLFQSAVLDAATGGIAVLCTPLNRDGVPLVPNLLKEHGLRLLVSVDPWSFMDQELDETEKGQLICTSLDNYRILIVGHDEGSDVKQQ